MNMLGNLKRIMAGLLAPVVAAVALAGCPVYPPDDWDQVEYDAGFLVGFANDDEYWQGYDDSYDTVDFGPIYYSGSEIPIVEDPAYDAGYYDGLWYAYNDGYFVAYDYAFTIGFSKGYDTAFSPFWPTLFANDEHVEYNDGGFSDGYNDGFTEGRIFGAFDYDTNRPFDWLDAMLDYRDGTDLDIGGEGTGYIDLYIYGTDPADLNKSTLSLRHDRASGVPAIRRNADKAEIPEISYRPLDNQATSDLQQRPATSERSDQALTLPTTWLERINAYRSALEAKQTPSTRK